MYKSDKETARLQITACHRTMSSKFGILTGESLPSGLTDGLGSGKLGLGKSFLSLKHGKLSIVCFEHQALFSKDKPCVLSDQTDFLSGQCCPNIVPRTEK